MMMHYNNIGRCAALVFAASLVASCASTSDLDSLKAMVEQAQNDAAMAKQEAAQARATAEQAMRMSQATDERTNRMFRRSMFK